MNTTVCRIVVAAIMASAARAPLAKAQSGPALPPTRSSVVCDPDSPSPYVACALWFDHGQLRRGAHGDVIARQGIGGPIPLTEMVQGDSARRYAAGYEQLTWIAAPLRVLGMIGLGAGFALSRKRCDPVSCSDAATKQSGRIWAISGISLFAISIPFTGAANRNAGRAVWWNNAMLRAAP